MRMYLPIDVLNNKFSIETRDGVRYNFDVFSVPGALTDGEVAEKAFPSWASGVKSKLREKRLELASVIISGLLAHPCDGENSFVYSSPENCARHAFKIADALMLESGQTEL